MAGRKPRLGISHHPYRRSTSARPEHGRLDMGGGQTRTGRRDYCCRSWNHESMFALCCHNASLLDHFSPDDMPTGPSGGQLYGQDDGINLSLFVFFKFGFLLYRTIFNMLPRPHITDSPLKLILRMRRRCSKLSLMAMCWVGLLSQMVNWLGVQETRH